MIAIGLKGFFGHSAFVLPYYLIFYSILLFAGKASKINIRSIFFFALIFLMISLLNAGRYIVSENIYVFMDIFNKGVVLEGGGVAGMYIGSFFVKMFGKTGLYLIALVIIIVSLMILINTPVSQFFDMLRAKRKKRRDAKIAFNEIIEAEVDKELEKSIRAGYKDKKIASNNNKQDEKAQIPTFLQSKYEEGQITPSQMKILDYVKGEDIFGSEKDKAETQIPERISNSEAAEATLEKDDFNNVSKSDKLKDYRLPPIDILKKIKISDSASNNAQLRAKAEKLEKTLQDFNVNAKVIQVTQGPAITRYEIQPNVGV